MVRNSIPDAPSGGGIDATISLYINGTFAQKLNLSSRNSWLYGTTDDTESLSNTPVGRRPAALRRVTRAAVAVATRPARRFKLQRDATDTASFYIIDFVDLEQVAPPISQPAGCTSITSTARSRTTASTTRPPSSRP